jgi:hypothetical protein
VNIKPSKINYGFSINQIRIPFSLVWTAAFANRKYVSGGSNGSRGGILYVLKFYYRNCSCFGKHHKKVGRNNTHDVN